MGFDLGAVLRQLFYTLLDLARGVGAVWNWLTGTNVLFQGLSFTIFDWTIILVPAFTFTPIQALGAGGILVIVVLWVIKALVPVL